MRAKQSKSGERREDTTNSIATLLVALACVWAAPSLAQDVVKIGMLVPLTGPFTPTGKQLVAGAKLYMQRNGDTVAGKKIELIIKDDTGNRRHDQAARAGTRGQRQGGLPGRIWADAGRAGNGADRHRGQDSANRDDGGDLGHHRAFALYRAHQLLGSANDRSARRLGGEERHQDGGDRGVGLCARHRRGDRIQAALRSRRRQSDRVAAGAAGQSRFCARACSVSRMPNPMR